MKTSARSLYVVGCRPLPGRILNEKTAGGQLSGGTVRGIGQALMEKTIRNARGRLASGNVSGYLVPVNADVPIDVHLSVSKTVMSFRRVKGLGELAICKAAAAIANAIFYATGRRFCDVLIKTELWFGR